MRSVLILGLLLGMRHALEVDHLAAVASLSTRSRNRISIVLRVGNLSSAIATLKKAGLRFRNEMEVGPGGRQIQIEDPDGNPIELFEPQK